MSIKYLKNWFLKPYYLNKSTKISLLQSFSLGIFAFLFLFIIKPHFASSVTNNIFLFALNSGIILTCVFLVYNFVLIFLFKHFFNENIWTVGKHLITFASLILIASFLNWNFNQYITIYEGSRIQSYTNFLSSFFIVAVFPISIYLYIDERILRLNREKVSLEIMQEKKKKNVLFSRQKTSELTFQSSNSKECISFKINDLFYINSQGNYASFFLKKKTNIKESVLRKQLVAIEKELKDYKNIVRCHKSYIVNTDYVVNISGNARGYFLHFNEFEYQIPVSRKFKKEDLLTIFNV